MLTQDQIRLARARVEATVGFALPWTIAVGENDGEGLRVTIDKAARRSAPMTSTP